MKQKKLSRLPRFFDCDAPFSILIGYSWQGMIMQPPHSTAASLRNALPYAILISDGCFMYDLGRPLKAYVLSGLFNDAISLISVISSRNRSLSGGVIGDNPWTSGGGSKISFLSNFNSSQASVEFSQQHPIIIGQDDSFYGTHVFLLADTLRKLSRSGSGTGPWWI